MIRAAFGHTDDGTLHRSYRKLALYYGFPTDSTPPRSPEKNETVESPGEDVDIRQRSEPTAPYASPTPTAARLQQP